MLGVRDIQLTLEECYASWAGHYRKKWKDSGYTDHRAKEAADYFQTWADKIRQRRTQA